MRPSRWEHFAHIYAISLLALVPGWVSYLRDSRPDSPYSAVCAVSAFLAPLLAVAAGILRLGPATRAAIVVASAGALGAYLLGAAVLLLAYPLWPLTLVVTPFVSGAALGSAAASVLARIYHLAARRAFSASSSGQPGRSDVIRFALWAGALTGAVAMPACIYLLMEWAIGTGVFTDSIYVVPLILSLAAPACCAAFLVMYLTRAKPQGFGTRPPK